MIKEFNETLRYLEECLCGDFDEKVFKIKSGQSYAMFSRFFSIITDMSLSEYLRFRKLTLAAIMLRETDLRIIDIALKFGYETQDSFGKAFKNFHEFSPMQVRNGAKFKVFSPLYLSLSVRGGGNMNIRIEKKPAFDIAGVTLKDIDTTECKKAWEELFKKIDFNDLKLFGNSKTYGVCYDVKACDNLCYMAAFDVSDIKKAKECGFETMHIEETEYAVAELKGKIPDCIHDGWKFIMEIFFPENGYLHAGKPDFEVYTEGNMYSDDYEMELWVPIKKA